MRKKRIREILKELHKLFPDIKIALNYKSNWQLLVAVVLSAQTTDKKVNEVTKKLFKKYKTVNDYAALNPEKLASNINSVNYYNNKARNIVAAAKMLKKEFGGRLPKTMNEITKLPGVGRKSANVILGNAYGLFEEGIAVDTHVIRLSNKYNLTDSKDPIKIEKDLMKIVSKDEWPYLTFLFVEFGRKYCPARKHNCMDHPVTYIYPKANKNWPKAR